jgi:predicted metal-binding membrane protein
MQGANAFASVLKRERAIVLVSLIAITLLAWTYLVFFSAQVRPEAPATMPGMPGMAMTPGFAPWSWPHAVSQFSMWSVMMVGMMTPSVAPMVLIYARVAGEASARGMQFAPPSYFALGYLLAWTLFAVLATASQWGLEGAALLTPMLATASRPLGGGLLIVVGAYQWSPLKESCLAQCRSPLSFVQNHGGFRPGIAASLRLGLLHGIYCIGCCWALMTLLFVAGVMNLLWVAAIMVFVLAEKIAPYGRYLARVAGLAAIVLGVVLLSIR